MAWQQKLRSPSFKGVPFFHKEARFAGGRRVAVFEFPLRDTPATEDLGRRIRRYPLTGYVLVRLNGDDYFDARDALLRVLQQPGPGTLVHPYLGPLQVQVESFSTSETQDEGGICRFDMEFIEAGGALSPVATLATQVTVIGAAANLLTKIKDAFAEVFKVVGEASFVANQAVAQISGLVNQVNAVLLPVIQIANAGSFAAALQTIFNTTGNLGGVAALANSVTSFFGIFSSFSVSSSSIAATLDSGLITVPGNPFLSLVNYSRIQPIGTQPSLDPTLGLAALTSFGATIPVPAPSTADNVQLAANIAAINQLVRISAIAAIAQIFARTSFQSANLALAALNQLRGYLHDQIETAASNGQDGLYMALQSLESATIIDMRQRASKLPSLTTYHVPGLLPSLALASLLYQDSTRDQELVALNDFPHPLFCAPSGKALSA